MKTEFPFVAVDWGTTHMRAMLCRPGQTTLDREGVMEGPGISRLEGPVAATLFDAIAPWVKELGLLDVLLGGMVGSNIGWRPTSYVSCPLVPGDLSGHLRVFEERGHRLAIVPGVSCVNTLGQPDVMRGEEIQVLGWMSRNTRAADGEYLLCLPGTHTKWVQLSNGELTRFTTSLTGELFALLQQHSVLIPKRDQGSEIEFDARAFREGVDIAKHHGDDLLHIIFSTRSRKLAGDGDYGDASSYLSGLLIGADLRSAFRANRFSGMAVELVGAPTLCDRFAMAIEQLGYTSKTTDGGEAAYAGFLAIATGDT